MAELCKQYELSPSQIRERKTRWLANAVNVFGGVNLIRKVTTVASIALTRSSKEGYQQVLALGWDEVQEDA